MEFNTEEDRTKFINGDREKRISLDAEDFQDFFKKLSEETVEANNNLEEVTSFYYSLENLIRSYDVGSACVLKKNEDDDSYNGDHQLCFEDIPNSEAVGDYKYDQIFWRIGYCKIGNSWHLAALRYKINEMGGRKPQHEILDEPIRLTHSPRSVRLQATHHIRDLIMLILENVKYNKQISESAVERIAPLHKSLWSHIDSTDS